VQCDINFSAHLALHNTLLLRCYSHTDPRVRPLILFVKHWAKARNINTPYRGTLSSYGYVLMVLHYLVNVVRPFVCPNLQELARPQDTSRLTADQIEETVECRGRNVQFWRNEEEILRLAGQNMLNQNRDSIGLLLRGFFEYYAQTNFMTTTPARGFDWGRDVLSLRTHDGLLTKAEKGWTGAKTVIVVQSQGVTASAPDLRSAPPPVAAEHSSSAPKGASDGVLSPAAVPSAAQAQAQASVTNSPSISNSNNNSQNPEVKEVRHRYLFAIEDPFELDHNVARTVTHNGIVAIRDEFRRAWRIIRTSTGKGGAGGRVEDIMEDVAVADAEREKAVFAEVLDELHGKGIFDD
jgi:terminal uridylyltransferase